MVNEYLKSIVKAVDSQNIYEQYRNSVPIISKKENN